jgi:DNA-binding MarR family transcriptional regulator
MVATTSTRSTLPAGSEPGVSAGCTSFKLHRLARLVGRRYDAQLAGAGLTTPQYSLLNHVRRLGPVRPVDLAHAMGLSPSTLTRNLQPLVDAGWLAVSSGPDARSRRLQLTESGEARRRAARQHWRQAQGAIDELLGVENVAQLHALLDHYAECLAEHTTENRADARVAGR